jgi:L-amino acid N-acyltransferase YncA
MVRKLHLYRAILRPMTIRAARDDDFETIAAITNHYIATTAIHFAYEPIAVADFRAMWQSYRERHPWLVIEKAGRVVGYAKSGVWRERAAYNWTCEVGLYIADGERGHGLGRTLYTALLDDCARRGFRSAVAGITLPNDASMALHERLGFVPTGVVYDAGWKNGAWHAVAFFQKRFATDANGPAMIG